jgi:hypothetical protein
MSNAVAGPDGSALSEGLGPNAPAVMSQKAICAALGAAAEAREQDLRGQYPMAARVLAEEVFRLRAVLVETQRAERYRLRGYFHDALADTHVTWPEEAAILYDKCFGLPFEPEDARNGALKATP